MKILNKIIKIINLFLWWIINSLPLYPTFNRLRASFLRFFFGVSIGDNTTIGNLFGFKGNITIGNSCGINRNVSINASGEWKIKVGNYVLIASNVVIRNADHGFSDITIPIRQQLHTGGDIIIEDDVWLASNVIVLPGVRIGTGSVIGAAAVVTKDIPPYSIAVGIPARIVKSRK
jgi:acetyltransferase-like isoleucine patch superfamily enzyme